MVTLSLSRLATDLDLCPSPSLSARLWAISGISLSVLLTRSRAYPGVWWQTPMADLLTKEAVKDELQKHDVGPDFWERLECEVSDLIANECL